MHSPRMVRRAVLATLSIALTAITAVGVSVPAQAGTDDYPAKWKNVPLDSTVDDWREYNRECTSFVAWRLHSRNGFEMPFNDMATGWGPDAQQRGFTVDGSPAVGAVAWQSTGAGHVAWVESVGNGTVTIEEYNSAAGSGAYHERTVSTGTFQYLHFRDITSPATPRPVGVSNEYVAAAGVYRTHVVTSDGKIWETWWGGSPSHTPSSSVIATVPGTPVGLASDYIDAAQVSHVHVVTSDGKIWETWWGGTPYHAPGTSVIATVG